VYYLVFPLAAFAAFSLSFSADILLCDLFGIIPTAIVPVFTWFLMFVLAQSFADKIGFASRSFALPYAFLGVLAGAAGFVHWRHFINAAVMLGLAWIFWKARRRTIAPPSEVVIVGTASGALQFTHAQDGRLPDTPDFRPARQTHAPGKSSRRSPRPVHPQPYRPGHGSR
jgi:hypothetical protein